MISKNQLGIIYMVFSVIGFSMMDISVKLMSSSYPTGQLIFFRGLFGLIPIFFIIPLDRYKNLLETKKLKMHIGRAVAGTFAMANLYLGLKFLPIADAITISFAAPIFATIFSIIFLKELVRFYRWFAIILGIIGVIVILRPGTTMFSYYYFFPILFCIGFAIISVLIKKLSKTEPDYLISMFFTIALILTGSSSFFLGWNEVKNEDVIYLVAIGLCGSVGNIFLTMSIRTADISLVTPVKYLSLLFAIMSGIFIFNEQISFYTLIGAFLIITSTVIIFQREAIKKVKRILVRQV